MEDSAQIKSKERIVNFGEVFTPEREVNAMVDMAEDLAYSISSRILEPSCGTGNFLAEILSRKLQTAEREAKGSREAFERLALQALASIYAVEIMHDNALEARRRLEEQTVQALEENGLGARCLPFIRDVLDANIVQGNFLEMMCVDDSQNGLPEPVAFIDWEFREGTKIGRTKWLLRDLIEPSGILAFCDAGEPMAEIDYLAQKI